METKEYKYVTSYFYDHPIYTFSMKVGDLLRIQYVAPRGVSTEQGAVQRILNKNRIESIKQFVLSGNSFVNTFIINWTDTQNQPKIRKETILLPLQGRFAQMLDGQHRIAGIQEAVNEMPTIAEKEVLVSLCVGLNTKEAAKIFLNINSEQKPVPKSLIYDLFGEAYEDPELALNRVTDIISFLNESEESPFYCRVRYPGRPTNSNQIDLAIMVNAMKPSFEKNGAFYQFRLTEIATQEKIICNFYSVIRNAYHEIWDKSRENIFLRAAGFSGAYDFLTTTLLRRCQDDRKFSVSHMTELMKLGESQLLSTEDIRLLGGRAAKTRVTEYLRNCYLKDLPENDAYEF